MNTGINNEAICASAGTGKTYQLVERYLALLMAGVAPEEIVALTFTRNAAGEIFERIIQRLLDMIKKENHKGKYIEILVKLLRSMHKLQISTLDSFFVKIITLFAFEFGLPYKVNIVDEQMQSYVKFMALKETLNSIKDPQVIKGFIEDFKKATFGSEEKEIVKLLSKYVENYHGYYLLCPDEAKWGKKDAIWEEKGSIVFHEYDIVKIATELTNLIESRVDLREKQKTKIIDFAKIAKEIDSNPTIKLDKAPNNYENFFNAYDSFKNGNATINVDRVKTEFNSEESALIAQILEYISKIKIEKRLNETNGIYKIIDRYEKIYDSFIRSNGIITFADLPFLLSPNRTLGANHYSLTSNSLTHSPDKLYIDYRIDCKFNHWLIDEFQDTSLSQWKIIENLIDEIIQENSPRRSFFYVGDPKQAIYTWRGGAVELFDALLDRYNGHLSRRELVQSYRSCSQVISTVNKVFASLKNLDCLSQNLRKKWNFIKHEPRPMDTERGKKDGLSVLFRLSSFTDDSKNNKLAKKAKIIFDEIKTIRPFECGLSVAVLCRSNDYALALAEEFRKCKLAVIFEGKSKITDNPVILTFLSLFKFAEHPGDNFARQHLLMSPFALIPNIDWDNLPLALLEQIQSLGFVRSIRYWKNLLETKANINFDEFSSQRLEHFIEAAGIFDASGQKSCTDFIRFIKDYNIADEGSENSIQCMTIHKAKGLEFDIVFLPELNEKNSILKDELGDELKLRNGKDLLPNVISLLPDRITIRSDQTLREWVNELDDNAAYENLCVLYVAMTRAREALYMIADPPSKNESETVRSQDILIKTLLVQNQEQLKDFEILYREGEKDWYKKWQMKTNTSELAEDEKKIITTFKYCAAEFETVKPSSVAAKNSIFSQIFSDTSDQALQIGTIIHYLFEQIEWIDEANIENIISNAQDELGKLFDDKLIGQSVAIFKSAIQVCEIRKELSRPPTNCDLWREKSFSIILDGKMINGQFDRVCVLKDENGKPFEAVILDYKSDSLSSDDEIPSAIEKHRPQIELYKKALSKLLAVPEEKISGKIVFIAKGIVRNL